MREAAVRIIRHCRTFGRDRRGATIVEFALIALPFFMLLCSVIETGVIFVGNSLLQKATSDAARLVRTGQAQGANMTALQFKNYICGETSPILNCANLQVDVESFSDFNNVTIQNAVGANGNINPNLTNYSTGGAGNIVLVRTFYSWDIVVPLLRPFFANLSNGDCLLTATAAFRNEPF